MDSPIRIGATTKQTLVEGTVNNFTMSKPYSSVIIHSDRNLFVRTTGEDAEEEDFYLLADTYLPVSGEWGSNISVLVAIDQDSDGVVRFTQVS